MMSVNALSLLPKELDRQKQLINVVRPLKPFRTSSSTTAALKQPGEQLAV